MKKNKKGFLYKFTMTILIAIILISGAYLAKLGYEYWQSRHTYKEISKVAKADEFDGNIDFDKLRKINPDIYGWLYLKDSPINHPVVQTTNNDKYLHTLFNGKWGVSGTLFVDSRNEKELLDFNSIIYGHRMRDGSMFATLKKFKEQEFYDKHKQFELITPEEKYHLKIISVYTTPATSDAYNIDFLEDYEKQEFIDTAISKSEVKTKYTADSDDRLVTLSTCAYDFQDARLVVVGKLVKWKKQ